MSALLAAGMQEFGAGKARRPFSNKQPAPLVKQFSDAQMHVPPLYKFTWNRPNLNLETRDIPGKPCRPPLDSHQQHAACTPAAPGPTSGCTAFLQMCLPAAPPSHSLQATHSWACSMPGHPELAVVLPAGSSSCQTHMHVQPRGTNPLTPEYQLPHAGWQEQAAQPRGFIRNSIDVLDIEGAQVGRIAAAAATIERACRTASALLSSP